jgi:hypothetical protein
MVERRRILKRLLILIIIVCLLFVGCDTEQECYSNGVPTYFLEPEGYTIAYIDCNGFLNGKYGYISNDDYQDYLEGKLIGALTVLNPYETGKSVSVSFNDVESIEIGVYKDYR